MQIIVFLLIIQNRLRVTMKKTAFIMTICLLLSIDLYSQEILKSFEEEYYDFLAIQGIVDKPTLNYRTLSDSVWNFSDNPKYEYKNPWKDDNLSQKKVLFSLDSPSNWFLNGIDTAVSYKLYGPDWYNSYNTLNPYGQNDGALWQGKGYNTSLTTGIRLEGFGLELTFRPQLSFSQNQEFEIMPSTYGDGYGYFWGKCDAPQRFGDQPFWTFDWGDTEIRYSWYNLTIGFGNQSIWLGPVETNPLLHSNNAPTYPKLDFGLRRTNITLPWWNFDLCDIEGRMWLGYLSESDYFDKNPNNDHNQIIGFNFSVGLNFVPGLTIGLNKVCLCKWGHNYWKYLNPFYSDNSLGKDGEDQKASITVDYNIKSVGFDLYAEIGLDDYVPDKNKAYGYVRYPFHAMTNTVGVRKVIDITNKYGVYLVVSLEFNNTEMSQDFQMQWPYNFGFHSQITQGYTNRGQWLGSGIGYGGNNQFLCFTVYHPHGRHKIFVGRNNPDNNYIYSKAVNDTAEGYELGKKYFTAFKANLYTGLESTFYINNHFVIMPSFKYNLVINPTFEPGETGERGYHRGYKYLHNFVFTMGLKYQI